MIGRLNRWQRLWAIFSLVFLASTIVLMATVWPQRDPGVIADLRSPECKAWRDNAEGVIPEESTELKEKCRSLRSFAERRHAIVRSEDEYDGYLARAAARTILVFLGSWAGFVAGVYVLGWSSAKIVRALPATGNRGQQTLPRSTGPGK